MRIDYIKSQMDKINSGNYPKWLKAFAASIVSELNSVTEKYNAMFGGESNVCIQEMAENKYLPQNSRIEFNVNGTKIRVNIARDDNGKDELHVMGDWGIFIQPMAANHFIISMKR